MDDQPTHLDLFTGLGGFAIAAQAAGFRTVAMCENEPHCQRFLARAWGIPVHPDIRELDGRQYRGVTLLTGGPPCQPASRAGKQQGGAGDVRWLWPEALRILAESEADCFVFENPLGILDLAEYGISPPLASDGSALGDLGATFDRSGPGLAHKILDQIEALGYEVQPLIVPACALDSPQLRERIWFVGFMADTHRRRWRENEQERGPNRRAFDGRTGSVELADSAGPGCEGADPERRSTRRGAKPRSRHVADTNGRRRSAREATEQERQSSSGVSHALADAEEQHGRGRKPAASLSRWGDTLLADSERERRERGSIRSGNAEEERSWSETFDAITRLHWEPYRWTACSDAKFRRAPDEPFDVAPRLHRSVLAALGNAVLPQIVLPILLAMKPHIRP